MPPSAITIPMNPDAFKLPIDQLREIRDAMATRIQDGLQHEDREIKALPAYLGPPRSDLSGRALVMDLGGTNVRAAIVTVEAGRTVVGEPVKAPLPPELRTADVSVGQFFEFQAQLAAQLPGASGLPVGYCFSYPSRSTPDGDSVLLRWTKEIKAESVVGCHVGAELKTALHQHGVAPGNMRVLNDTVATLLGGAYQAGKGIAPDRMVGLIVGTGSNMAGFFDPSRLRKVHPSWPGPMAVNLESGNFHPPCLNSWDELVDLESDDQGRQRFEKAVAGHYLPKIFRAAIQGDYELKNYDNSALLVKLRGDHSAGDAQALAAAILDRSADLVAAGIAGVLLATSADTGAPIGLFAEGSLFWSQYGYNARVHATLSALVAPATPIRIAEVPNANLIGAAIAALE